MRVLLSIALLVGLQLPMLMADVPSANASSMLGSAGKLVEASMATAPSVSASSENLALRVFALLVGILLLGVAAFMAFGQKQRVAPAKVLKEKRE